MLALIQSNWILICLVISEALVLIPNVKSNSVLQLVINMGSDLLAKIKEKLSA